MLKPCPNFFCQCKEIEALHSRHSNQYQPTIQMEAFCHFNYTSLAPKNKNTVHLKKKLLIFEKRRNKLRI